VEHAIHVRHPIRLSAYGLKIVSGEGKPDYYPHTSEIFSKDQIFRREQVLWSRRLGDGQLGWVNGRQACSRLGAICPCGCPDR
jgi:hypothetical protein